MNITSTNIWWCAFGHVVHLHTFYGWSWIKHVWHLRISSLRISNIVVHPYMWYAYSCLYLIPILRCDYNMVWHECKSILLYYFHETLLSFLLQYLVCLSQYLVGAMCIDKGTWIWMVATRSYRIQGILVLRSIFISSLWTPSLHSYLTSE